MNGREREQVKLIASYELSSAVRELDRRIRTIYADHGAKGRLHSGATIRVGVSAMQAGGETFLRTMAEQVRAVSRGHSALRILTDAVRDYLKAAADKLPELIRMASGRID